MVSIWVEGIDELNTVEASLHRAGGAVGAKGARVVRAAAHRVEATAKLFCPVDTGHLRGSIGVGMGGDGRFGALEAVIGTSVSYSIFVEHGTSRMAPQAFMGPALDRVAPSFIAACEALAAEALDL